MYASFLGDFYNVVAAFQAEVQSLERQIDLERRDPSLYLNDLALSIDSLIVAARDLEMHLAGAQDLVRDTQVTFRRLTSGFFSKSRHIERALSKPRGYAGDHVVLDNYYLGYRAPGGIERTLDEYVMRLPAVRAAVDRKAYVREWLARRLASGERVKVVDVACGPCRIERELLESGRAGNARFVAFDNDSEALTYAMRVLGEHAGSVELVQDNAVRLARSAEIPPSITDAHYMVSLGLLDYLPRAVSVGLLRALRTAVVPGGQLLIGNYAEGNPSQEFMEWVGDWPLIYRSAHDFMQLFLDAGFESRDLELDREAPDGIILLVTATVRP
jgi:extracellular factor (EF) 3-hydroxypalmitic acid methyl ester biosynthesis protein